MGAEPDSSQRSSEMGQGKKLGTGCMRGDADWRQGKNVLPMQVVRDWKRLSIGGVSSLPEGIQALAG